MRNRLGSVIILAVILVMSGAVKSTFAADYDWMKQSSQPEQQETSGRKPIGQYLLFRAGGYFPAKFNIGEGAEAGYGIQPIPWLAAETSFGFIEADNYDDDLNNNHTSFQMVPVTATVRAILPFKQFDIYALAGGGMYYTMINSGNANKGTTTDDDKVLSGFHYGGGVSLLLGASSSLGIEARRIETNWDDIDISGTFLTAFIRMGF